MIKYNFYSKEVNPKSFIAILQALISRYDVRLAYCDKKDSARVIHDILYYKAREYLKNI